VGAAPAEHWVAPKAPTSTGYERPDGEERWYDGRTG
jgi:hypothetical protein